MLPKPSLYFTIPSIHDHTKLDCRIYHPESLNTPRPDAPPWGRHVAIVAHPYAPLGGCYDDPIVDLVAGTLLQIGFMVATFNFRGASGGHTSWTSKAEQADYMSVVGFMAYYAHYLDFPHRISTDDRLAPLMLQAGYSYGAMVTTKIPPLDAILAPFRSPAVHTPAADIRLRAQHLAEQQNKLFKTPASPRKSLGMRIGGDESVPHKSSHDIRRSNSIDGEDRIRKGVKEILAKTKLVRKKFRHKPHKDADEEIHVQECMATVESLETFHSAYITVSPPLGFVTNLATVSFPNPFIDLFKKLNRTMNIPVAYDGTVDAEDEAANHKLALNPTLSICGDQDGFLTLRKHREWTGKLNSYDGSLFTSVVVTGAGHFWSEEGVTRELRDAIGTFGFKLLEKKDQMLQPYNGA